MVSQFAAKIVVMFWVSNTLRICEGSANGSTEVVSTDLTHAVTNACEEGTVCTSDFSSSTEDASIIDNFSPNSPAALTTIIFDNLTEATVAVTATTVKDSPNRVTLTEKNCDCDLTGDECDINCCCDSDCSSFDKMAFSKCRGSAVPAEPYPSHLKACYSSRFIYRNNVEFQVVESGESDVFCIAKDNYPEHLKFKDEHVITAENQFNRVWNRRKHYTWSGVPVVGEEPLFDTDGLYKYGESLWKYVNSSESTYFEALEFPSSLTSSLCDGSTRLGYLVDTRITCLTRGPRTEQECILANSKITNFIDEITLVTSPSLINSTQYDESPDEAFTSLQVFACREDSGCQISSDMHQPLYDHTDQICSQVVQRIQVSLTHNGTRGIVGAQTGIYFTDVALSAQGNLFRQEFEISFNWASMVGNSSRQLKRSGHPGYMVDRPIITVATSGKEPSIPPSVLPSDWMTLPMADTTGICGQKRINIMFGRDVKTQCTIQISSDEANNCNSLQNLVWKQLLGNIAGEHPRSVYIASYGDPWGYVYEWVPLQFEGTTKTMEETVFNKCPDIVIGISLRIAYSLVGPAANPQTKIIGASARAHTSSSDFECEQNTCRVDVTVTVNFVDVSMPPESHFAEPPVVRIMLPEDFFYPFLTGNGVIFNAHFTLVIILVIILS